MIAFLTDRLERATKDLRYDDRVADFNPVRLRGLLKDGREFIIASQATRLEGLNLTEYEIWGRPSSELIASAQMRIR